MTKRINSILIFMFTLLLSLVLVNSTIAQQPGAKPKAKVPMFPMTIKPDPRVEQRKYHFEDTNEDLGYVLYVSSKVSKDKKNPLIVALHGLGGDANFIVRDRLVDLAEEGGYIAVGPLGYNVGGWYGSPVVAFGGQPVKPPNLTELSEKDVMNVLAMMQKEFNMDYYYLEFPYGDHGTVIADGMPEIFRFFAEYTKAGKIVKPKPKFFQ